MIASAFAGTAVFAATGTTDDGFKYKTSGSSVTITGYDSKKLSSTAVIPSKIDNKTVTKIDDEAFMGCTSLRQITLSRPLRSIRLKTAPIWSISICPTT